MSLKQNLDSLLGRAAEAGDVPGVVAMVTDRERTLYEGAFGKRALGEEAPMTTDSVVWIASMSKALTGAAAMQLVEQGRLDLDAPASRYAPRIGEARVLEGFDAAGKPLLRAPKRPITLRHLLTHTAGYGYEFWSADIGRYLEATGTPGIISCTEAALSSPLLFDPGERWMYGIGIDWAGRMVEQVSGLRRGEYLERNLFEPLGMRDTAFRITPSMRSRLAKIHQRNDDDSLTAGELEIEQSPENEMGGGGLYGTAGDYLRFVRMILNDGRGDDGRRVLKAETVQQMSRNAMGETRVTMLTSAAPPLTNDAEFFPGLEKSWGLTFQVNEQKAPTGRPAGGLMWAGLANTFYWIDRESGLGGVYLSQILPFADKKSLPLFYEVESAVYHSLQ
jgi:methyl acetate hydrolase